jgi:hypothetical protein
MIPSILRDCSFLLLALFACLAGLLVITRRAHPVANWSRLRRLSSDERGGVQSLAFVMAFPVFLLVVLFVVQLAQLMIGVAVVHYASFATARAASVWIPAEGSDYWASGGGDATEQDELAPGISAGNTWTLSQDMVGQLASRKCSKVWTAAVLGCVPIAPSRSIAAASNPTLTTPIATSLTLLVQSLHPSLARSSQLPRRISNKVTYSSANTFVDLRFLDRSSAAGATGIATYNPVGHPLVPYLASEVGWQDPVEVTVRHRFALMPGPARWLAKGVANSDGRIVADGGVYKTTLSATTTMTVEGLQSLP